MFILTKHAQKRCQQRGIPLLALRWLEDYGKCQRHNGADVYYFTKSCRKELKRDIGNLAFKKNECFLDCYMVADGEIVLTVGKRLTRLKF